MLSRQLDEKAAGEGKEALKDEWEAVEFIKGEARALGWSLEGEDAGEEATAPAATAGAMGRTRVPVALEMKGAHDVGKGREPNGVGPNSQQENGVPTEEEVWAGFSAMNAQDLWEDPDGSSVCAWFTL